MKVYIKVDTSKYESEELESLSVTLQGFEEQLGVFSESNPELGAEIKSDADNHELALLFHIKQKKHLNKPLDFFNAAAKDLELDFEVGEYKKRGYDAVSYFGHEEGLADGFMIAQYLL